MRQYAGYALVAMVGAIALAFKAGQKMASKAASAPCVFMSNAELADTLTDLRKVIRRFENFPKAGIVFRDFLPVLTNQALFARLIRALATVAAARFGDYDVVVGLDARGFLIGPSLAALVKKPFVVIRKAGKLPGQCHEETYTKEYGADTFCLQTETWADATAAAGSAAPRVLIVDDVLATGGTLTAATALIGAVGGNVVGALCVLSIAELQGAAAVTRASGAPVATLMDYTDNDA
jgi:adenine phosphoribosyltransferase